MACFRSLKKPGDRPNHSNLSAPELAVALAYRFLLPHENV